MFRDWRDPVGMRVQVDKAGRDDQAARVDFARRTGPGRIAGRDQSGDFARGDRDVGGESRRAAAVDNRAVSDDQIVFHSGPIVALAAREGKRGVHGGKYPSDGCRSIGKMRTASQARLPRHLASRSR